MSLSIPTNAVAGPDGLTDAPKDRPSLAVEPDTVPAPRVRPSSGGIRYKWRVTVENKTANATAESAYKKKLDAPISYDFKWTAYENIEELRAAKDELTDEEQVKVRNTERQNNARQKALQAALDAAGIVKPTIENDDQLRLRETFKNLMSSKKYTEQAARDLAAQVLGLEWAE